MSLAVPEHMQSEIFKQRSDIDVIEFDEAWFEADTMEWCVPVEAYFTEEEIGQPKSAGWYHGTLHIEIGPPDDTGQDTLVDYYVGDWTYGHHPDLTFHLTRIDQIPDRY